MRGFIVSIMLAAAIGGVYADIVRGNGQVESERRSVPGFTSVSVSGSGTLRVHRGRQRVEIMTDSNILPYVTTSVSGGELTIGFKPFTSIMNSTKLQFDVSLPELTAVRISGSGDAYVDAFKGSSFKAFVTGSGAIKADLEYKAIALNCSGSGGFDATVKASRLDLRCSGSGAAYIKGAADRAEVALTGSGALGARNFSVADARVVISGSGEAEIKVAKSLDAVLSGSGSVKYWGSPEMSQRVSGSGRITKAGN